MPDREKVIKGLEYCIGRNGCWSNDNHEECPWIDKCREDSSSLKRDALALLKEQEQMYYTLEHDWRMCRELLKEQEAVVKQWTKEIADNQLAHAPDELDRENWDYKKGIWDGLQIAWNIISEGR